MIIVRNKTFLKRSGTKQSQRENRMKTGGEDGCLQAEQEALISSQFCQQLNLQLLACRSEKIYFCCLGHPACGTLLWQPAQANIVTLWDA